MTREHLVASLDQIPVGEGRNFMVGEREIAIFHTHGGHVHATQPLCPHLKGPLADGLLGGESVMCPLHDRVFDLKTGCGISHEQMQIEVFPARLDESGNIWVQPATS